MNRLKRYENYKDSDVEWLGEIPEHWEIMKTTHVFNKIGSGTTPTSTDTKYYDGEINWLQTGDLTDNIISETSKKITYKALKDFSTLKIYPKNSLVIAMYGATIGKAGILDIETATNQACCVLSNAKQILEKYAFYWFLASKNNIISMGYGGGQPNISQDLIKSLRITIPTRDEQRKIASFLDDKTAQIDEVISQKEKLIKLLKERKQIVINDAVTKGLDKDVEFVDSDVEWIGKIPKHWEVIKFKHLFYEKKKIHDISLNCGSISFGKVVEKNDEKIPASTKASYQVLNKGEFLINPLNLNYDLKSLRIGLSDLDVVVSSGYIIIKNKENIDKIYFNWLLHRYDIAFMKTLGAGVRQTLNFGDIAETLLVNPPIDEQMQIAEYIENQTTKIDIAIELQQNYISKLKEYKASLIDSVVTGKVKVS